MRPPLPGLAPTIRPPVVSDANKIFPPTSDAWKKDFSNTEETVDEKEEEEEERSKSPVVSSMWNQELFMISDSNNKPKEEKPKKLKTLNPSKFVGGWDVVLSESSGSEDEMGNKPKKVTY